MIDTISLLLASQLKHRIPLDNEQISLYKEYVQQYNYPACKFPTNFIYSNLAYYDYTLQENIAFVRSWITALFNEIYTVQEIEIIITYISLSQGGTSFSFNTEELALINPFLNMHSEKIEIEYFLDELRYCYLGALLQNNSQDKVLINSLFTHLLSIEKEHNKFTIQMGSAKNESR